MYICIILTRGSFPKGINWWIFLNEAWCVFFEVGTEFVNAAWIEFSIQRV